MIYILLVWSLFTFKPSWAHPRLVAPFNWKTTSYVYAFGDSYTFVQGTRGHANFSFIGDALNPAFTPEELLTNEIIPKNTSSDGSNWAEFLTGCTEGLPSQCEKQLWNFAFAGADIDKSLLPLHHDFSVDLVEQVQQFATYAASSLPHPSNSTLTMWWIGINDTGDTINNQTITDFPAFWETEMTSYFSAVQNAVDSGLGGTHLFLNVPPGERAPGANTNASKAAILNNHTLSFNAVLDRHVKQFAQTHNDINVLSFDAHAWFNSVLDSPDEYGFTDILGFCTCTDPGFFWYNSGHITERVHELLATAIDKFLHTF